jgi:hypothetical protein
MPDSDAAREGGADAAGTAGADVCRAGDLEVFSAGDGMSLVYARDSGNAGLFRGETVRLLASCRDFRTIDEHLRAYLDSACAGPGDAAARRELIRLSRAGYLVGGPGMRTQAADSDRRPSPVSAIAIPTCDRVPVLNRAIRSYAENCARHGRSIECTVADDAADADARARCQAMLKELAASAGYNISYTGREEKAAFASRVARAGGIPEEAVTFCCLPDRRLGATPGANRNILLLQSVGERFISVDDDTICNLALPPGHADTPILDSAGSPLEFWFFGERRDAFAAAACVEEDLVGYHERYLGEQPAPLIAQGGAASCRSADPALLRRVLAEPGRIRVTAGGVVGDCGWDNPDFYLFQEGASLGRLTGSAADFRAARTTREMIQAVTRPTITGRADPSFAMCIGLDNTDLLPPFPPVGRAEEVAFAAMLTLTCTDAYTAHLPLLVAHDPAETRTFSSPGIFSVGLGSWLPACMSRYDPGPAGEPAERLRGLGEFLSQLGRLPDGKFDEFARLIMWDSMSVLIRDIEEKLDGAGAAAAGWAQEARRFMDRARREALAPVTEAYSSIGGRQVLKRLLEQFGQLLIWWPAIVDTARELRAAGDRPARPVGDLP